MRINFVLANGGGAVLSGGTRIIVEYARRLRGRGHDVQLTAPARRRPSLRHRVKSLVSGVRRAHMSSSTLGHLESNGLDLNMLSSARPVSDVDLPDADVVIATWWETAEWVARLSERKGAKVYLVQGHEVYPYLPRARVEDTYRAPMQKIVVSRWLQTLMHDKYGDSDCILVPNAVDIERFNAPTRNKQNRPTIGFVYTTSPSKNVELAIKALESVKEQIPDLRSVAFGSRSPDSKLPMPGWIEFNLQPPQDAIPRIYAQCDAWLFTSKEEGFGLPILEAMACRTPVLATSAGAAPELVGPDTGMLLLPNSDAFVHAIAFLCNMDNEQWKFRSDNAYATARRYPWDNAVEQFEQALIQAVRER